MAGMCVTDKQFIRSTIEDCSTCCAACQVGCPFDIELCKTSAGVVELMAAGTVTLAHDSGGPRLDILTDFRGEKTGFLADSVDTYASALEVIFAMSSVERQNMIRNARESTARFSEASFEDKFLSAVEPLLVDFN